jgi:ApeA N-terminal domain 1
MYPTRFFGAAQYAFRMRVNEPFSFPGYFWSPEYEQRKVAGIIRVSDGGSIEVDLFGNFDGNEFDPFMERSDAPKRVNGLIEKHGYVTLENCGYRKKNTSLSGGFSKSVLSASHLVMGCHLDLAEPFSFNELRFSVDGLEEWLSIGAINVSHGETRFDTTINFQLPEKREIRCDDNKFKYSFDFGGSAPTGADPKQAQVTLKAFVRVRTDAMRPFGDFVEPVYRITQLLRLITGEKVSVREVYVTRDDLKYDFGSRPNIELRLFYQSLPFDEKVPSIDARRMLFSFRDTEERFGPMLKEWFKMYEQFAPALGLYFYSFARQHKYLDQRFLSLAQALETLHRSTMDRKRLPDSEYQTLKAQLIESCPKEHQPWLKEVLHFSNEIFLNDRIEELVAPFESHFGEAESVNQMIKTMKVTRNYLTHFEPSLKKKAAKGRDLWLLCAKAEALICLHLLHKIGLTTDELSSLAQRDNHVKDGLAAA